MEEEEKEVRERQTKKMTERKRAREEHFHVRSVSDFILFSFSCVRVLQLYKEMYAQSSFKTGRDTNCFCYQEVIAWQVFFNAF